MKDWKSLLALIVSLTLVLWGISASNGLATVLGLMGFLISAVMWLVTSDFMKKPIDPDKNIQIDGSDML